MKEKNYKIARIRSDHRKEFENAVFVNFFNEQSIIHDFSVSKTPKQNGVVELKNTTLQEMS